MGINSKVKILYDALKADGADVGSEQEFNDWFLRPGEDGYNNRKHVYDAFKEDGADIGESYEEFRDWLGLKAATVSSGDKANKAPTPSDPVAAVTGGSAKGADAGGGGKSSSSTSSTSEMSFRLRRGGKDFTVPMSEVNAAGGLAEWAKAHPGAPLRVYMSGDGFNGHVPLEEAHKRRKDKGYTYTLTDPAKSQGKTWKPTPMQKAFRAHSIQSQVDQFKASTDAMLERSQNSMDYYRGGGGITGAPVKGKVKVNPESGAIEQTYLTPTGTVTIDKTKAERETRDFNNYYADNMTVAGQLRRAGRDLERITQQLERRRAEIIDEVRRRQEQKDNNKSLSGRIYEGITGGDGMVQTGGSFMSEVNQILATDRVYRALEASRRKAQERVRTIQHENDRQSGKDVGFWRGFGEIVGDWRTWDFGYGDLQDAITLYSISNRKSGERSKEENEVLEQTAEAQAAQSAYGHNDSFWNRAGVMTGEMLPFMLDFALMGGARSGTSAVTRTIDAALLKTLRSAAPKVARNKAAQWTVKVLGAMPEDLLYRAPLMTNTVQGMKTASDIIDRKLGDVVVREDGTYDFSNDKTWGSAIWQGEANAIIENYSEMFGAHLEGVLSLNTLSKIADTFGAKRLSGILAKASSSELAGIAGTMQKHLNQLGVSDYFGEVGEEYYGQLWRTMLNLDDAYKQNPDGSRTNLFLDGQFHGDIWGGMALSMGLMGAGKYTLSAAAYGSMKHKVNKTDPP
ncbi:MAG: hypothetical protein K2F87_05470, partial [Muribaculaceae bacterium]|nr:hypothetical protein [Muribaculaceae bacterium]